MVKAIKPDTGSDPKFRPPVYGYWHSGARPVELPTLTSEYIAPSQAKPKVVEGSILDDGKPMMGILIKCLETGQSVLTDSKGRFVFANISKTKVTLELSYPTRKTYQIKDVIVGRGPVTFTLRWTWYNTLNIDPRHRIAAGLGAEVIRRNQEELMARSMAAIGTS
jgi:hypothetical protein